MYSNFFKRLPSLFISTKVPANLYSTCRLAPLKLTAGRSTIYNPVLSDPSFINQKHKVNILDIPISVNKFIIDVPKVITPLQESSKPEVIDDPGKVIEKQAARLIVIRRRKMKRHQLKKLRIKMKYVWAKVRQRREMKKEKGFQAELMCQIREAEKFNAVAYASDKIAQANYVPTPNTWKGKPYPEEVIKDIFAKKERKFTLRQEAIQRRKKMNLKVSDYKF